MKTNQNPEKNLYNSFLERGEKLKMQSPIQYKQEQATVIDET